MSDPTLKLTDGTTDISLLRGEDEFGLHLSEWTPAIADYKNEGIWRDSSLADSRRLVDHRWANVVETYELVGNGYEQNDLIRTMQDARRLLEKAASYWSSNWQDEPVWIEAKAKCETNTRYGLVYRGRIPEDDNPYAQPFFRGESAVLDDLALMVERLPWWLGFAPVDPCETQSTESQSYCFPSHLEFGDAANDHVDCGSNASIDDLPDFAVTIEAWVRPDGLGGAGFGRIVDKVEMVLLINAAGLYGRIDCATQQALSTSGADEFSPDGQPHHVLMCYDETGAGTPAARTIYLAIDGVWVTSYVVQTQSIGNYDGDSAYDLYIGNEPIAVNNVWDGGIGWVRISDSIRYDPAGGDFTPEPRCKLPDIDANVVLQVIYEGTGTTTYDRSGNDNDGAITGAAWSCDCTTTDEDDIDCDCVQASGEQEWKYEGWYSADFRAGRIYDLITLSMGTLLAATFGTVLRSVDDGHTWVDVVAGLAGQGFAMDVTPTGRIILGEQGNIRKSDDDGLTWQLATAAPAGNSYAVEVLSNGRVLVSDTANLYYSDDDGVTWTNWGQIDGGTIWTIFQISTGRILITTSNENIYYSDDDGDTWNLLTYLGCTIDSMVETDSGLVLASRSGGVGGTVGVQYALASEDAQYWNTLYDPGSGLNVQPLYIGENGFIYGGGGAAHFYLRRSIDEISFPVWARPGFGGYVTAITEADDGSLIVALFVGAANSDIWRLPGDTVDLGRTSCLDEVFVGNKGNLANLTDIFVYNASTATYVSQFPATLPFLLLPSPVGAGDIVYFGIEQVAQYYGVYCSLVFDILQGMLLTGAFNLIWEYSQGGAAWATLNVHDGTGPLYPFQYPGVNSVHWVPPTDWAVDTVNGVTALWVRVRVIAVGTWFQSPIQQNRDAYTVTWPTVEVDDAQVLGDIPALLCVKAHNRSDEDYYDTKDELDLLSNRMLVGLRSLDRGSQYAAYINVAQDGVVANTYAQNPIGITVTDGTGTTTGANNRAPAGICAVHTTPPTGSLSTYADAATITFGPSVARDFYGTYHIFLRAQLEEPSAAPAGDDSDVQVRLQVRSGSGGITFTTQHRRFVGWDANTEVYKDFQLLDFGRINLPVSSLFRSTELPNEFTIIIQISSASGTNLEVNLYDLVLIPVDEWAGDFIDSALEDDSGVGNGYRLDVDSLTYPKRRIRALVRSADSSEFIKAAYQPITPGPAILQANADQRLWFLSARAVYLGKDTAGAGLTLTDAYSDFIRAGVRPGMTVYDITGATSATVVTVNQTTLVTDANIWALNDEYMIVCNGIYRSEPWVVHSVQLRHNPRYLSFRGNR